MAPARLQRRFAKRRFQRERRLTDRGRRRGRLGAALRARRRADLRVRDDGLLAVSDYDGAANLRPPPDSTSGLAWIAAPGDENGSSAQCVRLGSILERSARGSVDVFKIDVEGSSPQVLEGAGRITRA
jgi:FkbM family methyltransferase